MVLLVVGTQLVYSAGEGKLQLFERLLLGGKAQVVGVDETVGATASGWSLVYTLNNWGVELSLVEGNFAGSAIRWCSMMRQYRQYRSKD